LSGAGGEVLETLQTAFGTGVQAQDLGVTQVVLRESLFFCGSSHRAGRRKALLAKKTAFDLIVGFILASILARAINGSEALVPTIAAGFVLALLAKWRSERDQKKVLEYMKPR
jgi:hypothetical protein